MIHFVGKNCSLLTHLRIRTYIGYDISSVIGVPAMCVLHLNKVITLLSSFSDQPEASAEHGVVHGGLGRQAELSCLVYAEPPAEVVWYRDTMRLEPNGRRYMESRGSRHTLIIRSVEREDFANYSCYAVNPLGKARAYLTLRGK